MGVENLTVGALADFIANVRFAGASDEALVEVVAEDNLGNPTLPHTIAVTVQNTRANDGADSHSY
ncbi:hypothetical protein [Hoyosella subflava]|uniref:Uncharacterized protein n=1 Tax=Hoyosella subflava (strain DSM 45089 / JCM 17490 / NBRC 109087 / DQS3-9A1) TaxID=443218 RepID=F6ESJ3_HOYSD|nr:hypothetical protein [Hoyosella subflava]AEF43114.1 hypothetical protein AS9A_P20070 [Hoyosella subflava DQS3-9A1]